MFINLEEFMAKPEDKFRVVIRLEIEKQVGGSEAVAVYRKFAATAQEYDGLDYEQLNALQQTAFSALVPALLAMGDAAVVEMKEKEKQRGKGPG
jgi:hypothetical protein